MCGAVDKGMESEGSEGVRELLVLRSSLETSGVMEILQQRASPLLSNVHLILQILKESEWKNFNCSVSKTNSA